MKLAFQVQGSRIRAGRQADQAARVLIEFYWRGSRLCWQFGRRAVSRQFHLRSEVSTIDVPPTARLAVIGIGLFGATGSIRFDEVTLTAGK